MNNFCCKISRIFEAAQLFILLLGKNLREI